MSKFKMVCLDIDGTLLNSEHKISKNTKEVIQMVARIKKIPVILVSARMLCSILYLQKELDIAQPVICYSGSQIWDNNIILSNTTLSIPDVVSAYEIMKNADVHISLYKDNGWYVETMNERSELEKKVTHALPNIVDFKDLFGSWKKENTGPNKMMCMAAPERIELLYTKIKESHSNKLNVYPSQATYLEVIPNSVSKTSAIELLCKRSGIDKSQVITIGDNYNDIDMLEFAGLGIAMGNAPDPVKQCADAITLSNDDDGVAEALRKYILY